MDPIVFEFADAETARIFARVVEALDCSLKVRWTHRVVDVTLAASSDPAVLRGQRDLLIVSAQGREGVVTRDPFKHGRQKLPKGFRKGHSDDLACPHRDVSSCPKCASEHPEILEVYGQHFWMPDAFEREALRAEIEAAKRAGSEAAEVRS